MLALSSSGGSVWEGFLILQEDAYVSVTWSESRLRCRIVTSVNTDDTELVEMGQILVLLE